MRQYITGHLQKTLLDFFKDAPSAKLIIGFADREFFVSPYISITYEKHRK